MLSHAHVMLCHCLHQELSVYVIWSHTQPLPTLLPFFIDILYRLQITIDCMHSYISFIFNYIIDSQSGWRCYPSGVTFMPLKSKGYSSGGGSCWGYGCWGCCCHQGNHWPWWPQFIHQDMSNLEMWWCLWIRLTMMLQWLKKLFQCLDHF